MNSPLVTVFMPVYNCEEFIKDSLESIINQTYKNIEILLVNDGSTDSSVSIIEKYKDPRIRLLHNSRNMGIPYTRNVGLKEAQGKYLVIMDSDDIAMPDRVEQQVDYLESHLDIDAVGSNYFKFSDNSNRKITTNFTSPEEIKIMLLFFDPISNPSSAIRLETLSKYQLTYNEEFFVAQDYELWAKLSKVGKISIMPNYLIKYRTGHENITKKSNREKQEKRKALIGSIREDLLSYHGIILEQEELLAYNEFFIHSYGAKVINEEVLIKAINKIKNWNKNINQSLNKEIFLDIMDYCIRIGISNQNDNLRNKLNLYKRLVSSKSSKDQLFIIMKHFYYQFKK